MTSLPNDEESESIENLRYGISLDLSFQNLRIKRLQWGLVLTNLTLIVIVLVLINLVKSGR